MNKRFLYALTSLFFMTLAFIIYTYAPYGGLSPLGYIGVSLNLVASAIWLGLALFSEDEEL